MCEGESDTVRIIALVKDANGVQIVERKTDWKIMCAVNMQLINYCHWQNIL